MSQNWWLCALLPRWSWDEGCTICAGTATREDDEDYEAATAFPEDMSWSEAFRKGLWIKGTGIDPEDAV